MRNKKKKSSLLTPPPIPPPIPPPGPLFCEIWMKAECEHQNECRKLPAVVGVTTNARDNLPYHLSCPFLLLSSVEMKIIRVKVRCFGKNASVYYVSIDYTYTSSATHGSTSHSTFALCIMSQSCNCGLWVMSKMADMIHFGQKKEALTIPPPMPPPIPGPLLCEKYTQNGKQMM